MECRTSCGKEGRMKKKQSQRTVKVSFPRTFLKSTLLCSEIASAYSTMTVFSLWHHYAPSPLHHVWMWKLDHKEGWVLKNWCFWTVVLKKTLESPLDSKEIKLVNTKGNQSWIFIGGTDAEAETPILWPLDVKNWLIGKSPDAGKDWRQEKRLTENEMIGWHHQLYGHEFE